MSDGTGCRVATGAIRAAVNGREGEVLDALGVAWREGRPHIRCPYPGHADADPSWRWDDRNARARCTCTRGDGIFDVVMKLAGIDFDAAKVRVAEILGRDDLVRQSHAGQRHQATDAASLLRPPPEQRADELPLAYLAHRLGVPVEEVPRPSTPVAGFKALAYFDPPPSGSKTKPKLVGHHPCAVFGTRAADGRRHAHRIYVAPGGAGKAELGIGPNGRSRDPKKSARVVGEVSTAGCAVLWGDPAVAPHLLVTEGIETGAAVALALTREIAAGQIAVAAAVSAAGVEAFQPWPATERVTVAADRDEAKADGRPGSRRGEQAARRFGLRCPRPIEVAVALPGAPGEDADWLDVLHRAGRDAVREGLRAAGPFITTRAEREEQARDRTRALELERIQREYPLPPMDTVRLRYAHTPAGRVKVHKLVGIEEDRATGAEREIWLPLATPFGVPARLRHADQANAYGIRVVVEDMAGRPRAVDFARGDLARTAAAEIRARLFEVGLRTEGDGELTVVQALKAADPEQEIVILDRPGWHRPDDAEAPLFVTPAGEVLGAASGSGAELQASARLAPARARSGTLEGWQAAVQAALDTPACPHWALGVISGLAGVVLDLAQLDSCGINLSGPSSRGKSTAQRLAASAWSTPKLGAGGLFRSMRVSENAVEAWAEQASGTVLLLDDLAHCDGRAVARLIYALAGGIGKGRMRADTTIRASYRWSTVTLLSAEHSLEETVRRAGGVWQAGMAVRVADVDVTSVNAAVDAGTLAELGGIERHFGHAGPAFVAALVADGIHRHPDRLREQVLVAARRLAGEAGSATRIRAATSFALLRVAGELARAAGILPPTAAVDEAVHWAWEQFALSTDALALDPAEQAIGQLQLWLLERWDVTVKNIDATDQQQPIGEGREGRWHQNNRESLAWYDATAVLMPTTRLGEACGGALKPEALARVLDDRGLLARRTDARRLAIRYVPKLGKGSWYALCRKAFGRASVAESSFKVHHGGRS